MKAPQSERVTRILADDEKSSELMRLLRTGKKEARIPNNGSTVHLKRLGVHPGVQSRLKDKKESR